jgi:arylsulfatase A-like enzyme
MDLLRRGAWCGLCFGLAAAIAESSFMILGALFARVGVDPLLAGQAALLVMAGSVVLGVLLSPLLLLRGGRIWHAVALAALHAGLHQLVKLDTPMSMLPTLVAPPLGLALLLAGLGLGRLRRTVPAVAGVVLLVAGCVAPSVYLALTRPEAPPPVAASAPPPGAPDVVLIVLDTVRAENMSTYGYARETSPVFTELAGEGALFLDATSPSTWSLPSHASLFTGRFPSAHGAHGENWLLGPDIPTLAESLESAGYQTSCFTSNAFISPSLGLTRGFGYTDEAWRDGGAGRTFNFVFRLLDRAGFGAEDKGGAAVVESFARWSAALPEDAGPQFTFLNFIEAHFPYHQLPEAYVEKFSGQSRAELQQISMDLMGTQFGGPPPEDPEQAARLATDMYDGGILYTDYLLGRVIESIRARGTLDRTLLIVMADHGEMLGEHGSWGHGEALYEPDIRVPLLLRYPPMIPAGLSVETPISTVGVYATVLELVGLDARGPLHVTSLMGPLGGGPPGGPVLAERFARPGMEPGGDPVQDGGVRVRTYRTGPLKLVETSKGDTVLFDLAEDPGETTNLAGTRRADVARLQSELDTWSAALGLPAIDAEVEPGAEPELDPEARERLKALGYVG